MLAKEAASDPFGMNASRDTAAHVRTPAAASAELTAINFQGMYT